MNTAEMTRQDTEAVNDWRFGCLPTSRVGCLGVMPADCAEDGVAGVGGAVDYLAYGF